VNPVLALLGLLLALVSSRGMANDFEVGLFELINYYEYSSRLLSSAQPTRDQFPLIEAAGVEAIINLAPVTEPTSLPDEKDLVEGLGLAYTHIPVDWDRPAVADFDRFMAAMRQYQGQRILVHCYAGSRASAFVYLYRIIELGEARQPAHATLVTIWDNNPDYALARVPQWQSFIAEIEQRSSVAP
jgi:protein tyrosine phosphatase (PTP) superfamily phosphohydrolase (DUF442 family)